eukprot:m.35005 g.35005  ORF g.35005 m.35005 type:complete len:188 (-) comp9567_c1_seq1:331-894(-)
MAVKQSGGVITWTVPLKSRSHKISFEHGTTTGRRVICVDDVEIRRQNWMFKLVGSEEFSFLSNGQEHHATISIEPMGFNYSYTLLIDDKPLDSFKQNLRRTTQTWRFPLEGLEHSVVLDKETMEIYVDGTLVESQGEFGEESSETHFEIGHHSGTVVTGNSVTKKNKIDHRLFIDEREVDEDTSERN